MPTIIYVEDEPNDAFFMERAIKQCGSDLELKVLTNGNDASAFFNQPVTSLHLSPPGLVLLDLNLPGRSGLDILQEIRSRDALKTLPVIVYTSSNQAVDIVEAYRRGCSGYLIKPRNLARLKDIVTFLIGFWIKENQYPPAQEIT